MRISCPGGAYLDYGRFLLDYPFKSYGMALKFGWLVDLALFHFYIKFGYYTCN
jgi:hypothetical protein